MASRCRRHLLKCHEYDVMTQFSLLSASDNFKKWTGFLVTEPRATLISLLVPHFPLAKDAGLGLTDLDEKTVEYWNPLLEKIPVSESDTFLTFLKLIVEEMKIDIMPQEEFNEKNSGLMTSSVCTAVIDEVEGIGIQHVTSLSRDLTAVVLKYLDESDRQHLLKINVTAGYPDVVPKITAELPFALGVIAWPHRISDIYKMFKSYVDKCCQFWDDMEELDQTVRVIDPLQPGTSYSHRRILLEDNVAVHLIFNPCKQRDFPTISFAGPDKLVAEYSAALDKECNTWDASLPVIRNLKSILDCNFMSKEIGSDEEDQNQEPCPICYTYEFNDEIPEIVCICGTAFHPQCLVDFFVSDMTKSTLCRRVVECFNCQQEITVPQSSARTGGSAW